MIHSLSNNNISIKVNTYGAELCSVYSKQHMLEYIWQADKDLWPRHAPNLFPIVGKLKNNEFYYIGRNYTLPQHGFARDNEFICVFENKNSLIFQLKSNENTLINYPFNFKLNIIYELIESKLVIKYEVYNTENKTMFFSIGAHPAFNCPLTKNEVFEDYELKFDTIKNSTITKLNNGLLTRNLETLNLIDNKINVSKTLFNNDALVFVDNQIKEVSLISKISGHGVTLNATNWPYFGIWTKPNSEKFICLEPWFGICDSENTTQEFVKKNGIIKLDANNNFHCSFYIDFY